MSEELEITYTFPAEEIIKERFQDVQYMSDEFKKALLSDLCSFAEKTVYIDKLVVNLAAQLGTHGGPVVNRNYIMIQIKSFFSALMSDNEKAKNRGIDVITRMYSNPD